jgi:hypothetical protein
VRRRSTSSNSPSLVSIICYQVVEQIYEKEGDLFYRIVGNKMKNAVVILSNPFLWRLLRKTHYSFLEECLSNLGIGIFHCQVH